MTDTNPGAEVLFPTQRQVVAAPLPDGDLAIGAPHAPLAKSFSVVPERLEVCQPVATQDELNSINQIRSTFNIGEYQAPYVLDIARSFRLIRGSKIYLEIGTFDRGNLAYVSSLLADDAIIIGIDVIDEPLRDEALRHTIGKHQTYHPIVGSSRSPDTVEQLKQILNGRKLDAVFIDGDHTAFGVMSDYANYEEFVKNDGVFLFHDSVWEGDSAYKGSADALAEIDRLDPVYLVDGENPVRRFLRPLWRNPFWGVVGVVFASSQLWRRI